MRHTVRVCVFTLVFNFNNFTLCPGMLTLCDKTKFFLGRIVAALDLCDYLQRTRSSTTVKFTLDSAKETVSEQVSWPPPKHLQFPSSPHHSQPYQCLMIILLVAIRVTRRSLNSAVHLRASTNSEVGLTTFGRFNVPERTHRTIVREHIVRLTFIYGVVLAITPSWARLL